jgi:site-specific DNA-methyltransferase (adenine-specific)
MAARVEVKIGETFNVLNHIVWWKTNGNRNWSADKSQVRSFLPNTERIIFAEHYGADNIAKGEAGYDAKCDELRGFVFEPIRAYLDGERQRAGISTRQVAEAFQKRTGSRTVTGMAGHWFTSVQWALPTEENYQWIRETLSRLNHGGAYLTREYEDLRREYEDLRREYEDLRRPFTVSADVPYTDVWDFPTVSFYPGKHPCEKPAAMIRHIVTASSKPGAVVLDCFMGSGVTGEVCKDTGRDFIGIDADAKWFNYAKRRIEQAQAQPALPMEATS